MQPLLFFGSDELFALLKKGDVRCQYQIGDLIEKIFVEPGDVLPLGTKGKITGNLYIDESFDGIHELYLIKWDTVDVEGFARQGRIGRRGHKTN